jgi:hypothetical protein
LSIISPGIRKEWFVLPGDAEAFAEAGGAFGVEAFDEAQGLFVIGVDGEGLFEAVEALFAVELFGPHLASPIFMGEEVWHILLLCQ